MNSFDLASFLEPETQPDREPSLRLLPAVGAEARSIDESIDVILSSAVRCAGDAIVIIDAEHRVRFANQAFEALTGLPRVELVGSPLECCLGEVQAQTEPLCNVWSALAKDRVHRCRICCRSSVGPQLLEATFSEVSSAGPHPKHFLAILRRASSPAGLGDKVLMPNRNSLSASGSFRRLSSVSATDLPPLGQLTLHPETHSVSFDERRVSLTRVEYRVFGALAENRGKWISSAELLALAFGADYAAHDSLIRVHVHKIRRKLGVLGTRVQSAKGRGYIFV